MGQIVREVAEQEVANWLDQKKVSSKKRELHKDHIENLIESVMDGTLTVTPEGGFVQRLKFPLVAEDKSQIETLIFKQRVKIETIQMHLQGVKGTDNIGMINGYIAALTTNPKALIKTLDTEDFAISYGIAIFFM